MSDEKSSAAVFTRYYKLPKAKIVIDHAKANRKSFTNSINVKEEYTKNNVGIYLRSCNNAQEGLDLLSERYKKVTGKKVRSDFNILFEHVVVLSEARYKKLEIEFGVEVAKQKVLRQLVEYSKLINKNMGFTVFAVELHLDEGHFVDEPKSNENSSHQNFQENLKKTDEEIFESSQLTFKRNIHAHVHFYNYDFKEKRSPLRLLMRKGKNAQGRTNQLNPNFEKIQDLVAEAFKPLNFVRGMTKNISNRDHLSKEAFVKSKLQKQELESERIKQANANLLIQLNQSKSANEVLKRDIHDKAIVLERLESQVSNIKGQLKSLEKAIKSKCKKIMKRIALRVIKQNTPSTSVNRR